MLTILCTAYSDMTVVTILVGNKTDLKDAREVNTDEGKAFAEAHGLFFMETSALGNSNVAAAFETVVKEIYDILSRKIFHSQEIKKDGSSLGSGRAVVLREDDENETSGASGSRCCFFG